MNEAEHRGRGPDPERQRHHGDGREPGVLAEHAEGDAQVSDYRVSSLTLDEPDRRLLADYFFTSEMCTSARAASRLTSSSGSLADAFVSAFTAGSASRP